MLSANFFPPVVAANPTVSAAFPPLESSKLSLREAALLWHQFGFSVIPLVPGQKVPSVKWDPWLKHLSRYAINRYWRDFPRNEVGFVVGDDTIVFDADSPASISALEAIEARFGLTPSLKVQTKKGEHHHFRLAAGALAKSDAHCTETYPERIDVKTGRALVILPPSPGKYVLQCQAQTAIDLSEVGQDFVNAIALHNGRTPPGQQVGLPEPHTQSQGNCDTPTEGSIRLLRLALDRLDADFGYDDWFKVCAIVFNVTGGSDEGYEIFDKWSSAGQKYKGADETLAKWRACTHGHPHPVGMGTLARLVEEARYCWSTLLVIAEFSEVETNAKEVIA